MQVNLNSTARKAVALATAGGVVALLGACQTVPDAPPKSQAASCILPVFATSGGTQEVQEKGGIRIVVAQAVYTCKPLATETRVRVTPTMQETLMGHLQPGYIPNVSYLVADTDTTALAVDPGRMALTVTIKNNLPRVFRGAGTVVRYQVDGKGMAAIADDYVELSGLLIPPHSEQQVVIYGPALANMGTSKMFALDLYDVAVKTDAAGNVLARENFEWTYGVTERTESRSFDVKTTRHWIN